MKVLLADDDRDQLHLRGILLAKGGFEIIEATDSASALSAAAAQKPACAVVDLRFPTQALGLALIRALKALDGAIRVIVLTGSDPSKFDGLPEKRLVEEVMVKGGSSAHLLTKLRELAGVTQGETRERARIGTRR
jgi:DNA-binding response OmpR family regulator